MVHNRTDAGKKPSLEVFFYWDRMTNAEVKVNGRVLPSLRPQLFAFIPIAEQHTMRLESGEESLAIEYASPSRLYDLSVSAGIGPYLYHIEGSRLAVDKWVPFGTLYAGYFLKESLRVVSFAAFPMSANPYMDVGLYVSTEQFRGIDERFSVNFLLGAHVIGFSSSTSSQWSFSAPQGIEMSFRDFMGWKRQNFSFGGFFYPTINRRSYFNTWIRIGSSSLFWEINYISWQEPVGEADIYTRSIGLSVGFPLFSAL